MSLILGTLIVVAFFAIPAWCIWMTFVLVLHIWGTLTEEG